MNKILDHKPDDDTEFEISTTSANALLIGFGVAMGVLISLAIAAFCVMFAGHA